MTAAEYADLVRRTMAMLEQELEAAIDTACLVLHGAQTPQEKSMRSPQRVAEIERQRGIR